MRLFYFCLVIGYSVNSLQRIYWFFNDTPGSISVFFYKKIYFAVRVVVVTVWEPRL